MDWSCNLTRSTPGGVGGFFGYVWLKAYAKFWEVLEGPGATSDEFVRFLSFAMCCLSFYRSTVSDYFLVLGPPWARAHVLGRLR